jgi:hypothetical protein
MKILDEQMKETTKEKKCTHSQTSRLENPAGVVEKLKENQLHHKNKIFLFLTVLLLFAQRKAHIWYK